MSDEHHGISANPRDWPKTLFYVALLFSVFQIITAAFSPISSQVLRAVHVGFLLWVVFLSYPAYGSTRPWQPLAWLLSLAGIATALYQWVFEADLIQRSGDLTPTDMAVGIVLIALVFEAARRVMGIALPVICGLFLAYGLLGDTCPANWPIAVTASTRSSINCPSAPKGCTGHRPTCRQPTFSCSSCLARSSNKPA